MIPPPLVSHNLRVVLRQRGQRPLVAVDGVDLTIAAGEVVALVGESGCGKSLTGLALMGLLPPQAELDDSSSIQWHGREMVGRSEGEWRTLRGNGLAMIFQDPLASLNPVLTVGDHLVEAVRAHRTLPRSEATHRALALLEEVGIGDPAARFHAWPHQLSGGMRQRVMTAMALAAEPELLIADEPTTALDVTVQAQILDLLDTLAARRGMAVLLITHDLAIVAARAHRVCVMYAGRIVEQATTATFFRGPSHPYSRGLLAALPRLDTVRERLDAIPGMVPTPGDWPDGCRFHPRCQLALPECGASAPELVTYDDGSTVACWRHGESPDR